MKTVNRFHCNQCGAVTSKNTRIEQRRKTFPVKGEDTEVLASVRVCAKCSSSLSDVDLDNRSLEQAFEIYRRRHGIISPDEIRTLREKYGLSQRSLGQLLGWGEVTIHRYEKGSLPDESHNQVLRFLQEPLNMEILFNQYGSRLSDTTRSKFATCLEALLKEDTPEIVVDVASRTSLHKRPDVFSGFRRFSPDILMEMIVFFASKGDGVLKTKLNKLLWYADFVHYHRHSVSISGATYVHLPYGPAPDNYQIYLYSLTEEGELLLEEKDFGDDFVGENIRAMREVDTDLLPGTAMKVLEAVHEHFRNHSSRRISQVSHMEEGYRETQVGDPISYDFADRLRVNI